MARNPNSEARKFLEKQRGAPLTFGGLMRSVREGDERTLEDMAQALGVSRAHLCDVEQGRRRVSAERAARWAEALGYPPALFVQLALQDEVNAAGLHDDIDVFDRIAALADRASPHGTFFEKIAALTDLAPLDPDEPEELRTWRLIAEQRERWKASIRRAEKCESRAALIEQRARSWFHEQEALWGHERDERRAREFSQRMRGIAVDAARDQAERDRERLKEVDSKIASRPAKAAPPRKICEDLERDALMQAMDAVERYLQHRDVDSGSAAMLKLTGIARGSERLDSHTLERLETEARERWADRGNRLRDLARYIVARVAGLPPDSRRLR